MHPCSSHDYIIRRSHCINYTRHSHCIDHIHFNRTGCFIIPYHHSFHLNVHCSFYIRLFRFIQGLLLRGKVKALGMYFYKKKSLNNITSFIINSHLTIFINYPIKYNYHKKYKLS